MSESIDKSTTEFVSGLISTVPEARDIYRQHMDDNGELLPHVLFGDVTRLAIDLYRKSKISDVTADAAATALHRLLSFLETVRSHESSDSPVGNVIDVSFLENLHQAGPDYDGIKSELGPNLRASLEEVE